MYLNIALIPLFIYTSVGPQFQNTYQTKNLIIPVTNVINLGIYLLLVWSTFDESWCSLRDHISTKSQF